MKYNKLTTDANKVILLIIILVATFLRLWKLGSVPFMHDEFSALSRTQYDNLHDLLKYGVMIGDSHPAGVQLFLYFWTQIFGWSEMWLKLPFALLGLGSVYLIYVIGRQWFNESIGLISAAFVSVSELFLFYSQLIRPYSPGLFFVLLFVFFWNKLLFDVKKPTFGICAGFALSAFFAAEMQMFSMIEAGIIGVTGLFFLKKCDKTRIKAYLWSCAAAVLLFLPTVPIFYYQIFVYGSIGGWLSRPEKSFIIDFFKYSMNYSNLFIFSTLIIILLPFILGKRIKDCKNRFRIISIVWFVVPFAVALAYSYIKEPIIQYSTLIFSFPFLIITAFSFFDEEKINIKIKVAVVGAMLLFGLSSLVFDRQYFYQMYNQGFDQIAKSMAKDCENYNNDISFASYADRSFMNEFYQKQENVENVANYCQNDNIYDFQNNLGNLNTNYLGIGLADHADVNWEVSAVAEFPYLVNENAWFTTRYLTLSKTDNGNALLKTMTKRDGSKAENVHINKSVTWACSCTLPCDSLSKNVEHVGLIADIQAVDTIKQMSFIAKIVDTRNDSTLLFRGYDVKDFIIKPGERQMLPVGFFIPNTDFKYLIINVFIWNRENVEFDVNRISYYEIKKNKYFYGLYDPL